MRIHQPPRDRQLNLREGSVASRPRPTRTGSSALDSPRALPLSALADAVTCGAVLGSQRSNALHATAHILGSSVAHAIFLRSSLFRRTTDAVRRVGWLASDGIPMPALLSPDEQAAVVAGLRELEQVPEDHSGPFRLMTSGSLWYALDLEYPFPQASLTFPQRHPVVPAEPPYAIGMTEEFIKSIRKYDKALQARILVALSELCKDPTSPKGDTVMPLKGSMRGFWRYRIGDFRLLYRADPEHRRVMLMAFTPREAAYD